MDPTTFLGVGAGGAILGGIAQYINSSKAQTQNQSDMNQLKDLYSKLQQPGFDTSQITPQQYKIVQQYIPEVAAQIKEAGPTTIQTTPQMQAGQAAQRAALDRLMAVGNSSTNPELQAQTQQALNQAQGAAQARQATLMDQYNRQGMLGSGVQLAAQLQGNQDAMSNANAATQNAANQAYQTRLQALQQGAQLGGQMNQQDAALQAQNAGILNAFNQRVAQQGQAYQNYAAGTQNQAQQQNIANAQQIGNLNTQTQNQADWQNQTRNNQLAQQAYQNQLQSLGGQRDLTGMQIGITNQGAAGRNAAIQGATNAVTAGSMYGAKQAYKQQNSIPDETDEFGSDTEAAG